MNEASEKKVCTEEDALTGLKIIRESSVETEKGYYLTCIKLLDAGFRTSYLRLQITKMEKAKSEEDQHKSISQRSEEGDFASALNFILNFMDSYSGAQYVREQFLDLLENFILKLSKE